MGIIKMIIIQTIQGKIIARKKWSQSHRIALLVLIFIAMLGYDIKNLLLNRNKNLYETLELSREASTGEVRTAIEKMRNDLQDEYY